MNQLYKILLPITVFVMTVVGTTQFAFAQTPDPFDSPVPPPTVGPVPTTAPDPSPDPDPEQPPLSEVLRQLIEALGQNGIVVVTTIIGTAQTYLVSQVRRWFPNDEKTATALNGGIAQVAAGLTAIASAGILWLVAFLAGQVGALDIAGLLELAGFVWFGGFGIHKLNKVSPLASAAKTFIENINKANPVPNN